jgi:lysophospholipase L1-like esterase
LINALYEQSKNISSNTTHIFISIGGNNIMDKANIVNNDCKLSEISPIVAKFEKEYHNMIKFMVEKYPKCKIIPCTIYYPPFDYYEMRYDMRLLKLAVNLICDCIIRTCGIYGLKYVDLRNIFTEIGDFANPIEPSSIGSKKFVDAIIKTI